jgi:hypothetical protein
MGLDFDFDFDCWDDLFLLERASMILFVFFFLMPVILFGGVGSATSSSTAMTISTLPGLCF